MVNSVLSVGHKGLTDWLIQRITATIMLIYSIGMIGYFLIAPPIDYMSWHLLFTHPWMKITTVLFIAALLCHTWMGMWTVLTDYVKPFVLRLIAHIFVFFTLVACFIWALQILWGV